MIYNNLDFKIIATILIVRNKTSVQKFNFTIEIKYHKFEIKGIPLNTIINNILRML